MRRGVRQWVATGVVSLLLGGGVAIAIVPPDEVIDVLSSTTESANEIQLRLALGDMAAQDLAVIASDPNTESGLRIRAYSALRIFDEGAEQAIAQTALSSSVISLQNASGGVDILLLKASMIALARVAGENSFDDLVGVLQHPSRDVRAACARALGRSGSPDAIQPLRNRALIESEDQVQLAIADAIFLLNSQ